MKTYFKRVQTSLQGGLGNQMFQYAFGKTVSSKLGADFELFTGCLGNHHVKRTYQLDLFNIHINTDKPLITDDLVIMREDINANPKDVQYPNSSNIVLVGYWQNLDYFKDYEIEIREDFDLGVKPVEGRLLVQVRRGDYLGNSYHEYCNLDWYKRAISEYQFDEVYFTSDDIEWCKQNFNYIEQPKTFIEGNELTNLKAMGTCDSFVISNSSFGWWGAWLSGSKLVTCPAIWTPGNEKYNPTLPNWNKLK